MLSAQELEGENFIAFDEDLSIRRQVDRFFKEHEVEVNVVMQFDNIQTIKEAVALGNRHQHSSRLHDADGD